MLNAGPNFPFTEAVSFSIKAETQEQIDYYWNKLISGGGQESMCGWLKDKYGVSWQVASTVMFDALKNGSPEQIARVTQAFMTMKKVDIAKLQQAYN